MFKVGQKVVCVDDSPPQHDDPRFDTKHRVVKGQIYIIRGFDTESADGVGLLLEGMVDPIVPPFQQELGWRPSRFRPVVEPSTDISIFTQILDDVNAGRVREVVDHH